MWGTLTHTKEATPLRTPLFQQPANGLVRDTEGHVNTADTWIGDAASSIIGCGSVGALSRAVALRNGVLPSA